MAAPPDAREIHTPGTWAALVGMCLIWGSTFLIIRIGNEAVPPLWGATLRMTLAAPLCLLIARATGATFRGGPALRAALAYGVFNYGVNMALLYWGEQFVASGTAAVMYATVPLTTGFFASALGVQALRARQVLGALVGVAGVAVIFWGELGSGGPPAALAAVFGGTVAASLSGVLLKKGPPQSTWVANGIGSAAGAVICALASIALGEPRALPRGVAGWAPIGALVLAGNLGAYALYGWLMTKWKVTSVNVVALVIPVIAVVLGALVRAEAPPSATYAGSVLVLAGVALTLFGGRR